MAFLALLGLASAHPAAAQGTGSIVGVVNDSMSTRPIEGAQVFILGTSHRATTTATGQYRLAGVRSGTVTVQVRALGFAPMQREVTVASGGTENVDFQMRVAAVRLGEIVAVGYGESSRRELSTAVSSVSGSEVSDAPVAGMDVALLGKAPGVQVIQNAGNPGHAPSIRIRGSSSLSAGNEPLWVVDGVPVISENFAQIGMGLQDLTGVTGISPDEVESIDILKDAAATAIYGSRGSNGVILVTTRRGRAGAARVTFGTYYGTQDAANTLELLSGPEYLELLNEARVNSGSAANFYGVPGTHDLITTDWQDEVLRRAAVSNFELGVSGGDPRIRYSVMGSYFDQEGIVIGSGYDRVSGRANLDIEAGSRLTLRTSLGISREVNERVEGDNDLNGIITNAVGAWPLVPARQADGSFTPTSSARPVTGVNYPNPLALASLNSGSARTIRALGNVEGVFALTGTLRWTNKVGFDLLSMRELQYESPLVSGSNAAGVGGVAKSGYSSGNRYVGESFLTFDQVLNGRHAITLVAGAGAELNNSELNFVRGEQLSSPDLKHVRNAAVITEGDASASEHNLVSFFTRGNYVLDGRYILGASLRTDGSSRFGPNNRFGVFPSASVAWLISEEGFFALAAVDELKLRGSWGLTGNQAISNYPYQGLVGSANYDDEPGIAPGSLANEDLKWESTVQRNIGMDLTLLDGRLSIIADFYRKDTRDLLLDRPVPLTSGFSSIFANVGGMRNTGWELQLGTINLQSDRLGGIEWSTDFNIAHNKNRVTRLADPLGFTSGLRSVNLVRVGEPLGAFYVLKFNGVDPATGDAMFEDVDDNGLINANDRVVAGSPHPDYTGGLTNRLRIGGLEASVFLQFSQGAEIYNLMRIFSDASGDFTDNHLKHAIRRWQQPGDITDVPRAESDGSSGAGRISSRFIEDGSYWRLQEASLAYQLPSSVAGALRMSEARIFVSGRNLVTWTDYLGFSPDANSNGAGASSSLGVDYYSYPLARTITFGIRGGW